MPTGPLGIACFLCAPCALAWQLMRGSQVQGDHIGARGVGGLPYRLLLQRTGLLVDAAQGRGTGKKRPEPRQQSEGPSLAW